MGTLKKCLELGLSLNDLLLLRGCKVVSFIEGEEGFTEEWVRTHASRAMHRQVDMQNVNVFPPSREPPPVQVRLEEEERNHKELRQARF